MPGRGTTDAIFIMRQLLEKYEMAGRGLYMVFVDLEKAFDRVPREVIWWSLRRKGVLEREIKVIMEMYTNIETSVKVEYTRSESFDVKVGVHQGSILSPLLFPLVMDEVTKDIREGVVKEMLYADDIVLVGDNWEEVESRYTRWKKALQEKGMKINVNKTKAFYTRRNFARMQMRKYPCSVCGKGMGRNSMQCTKCKHWVHKRCSGVHESLTREKDFTCKKCIPGVVFEDEDKMISLDGDNIEVVDKFSYLGDVISTEGGAQEAVTSRIRSAWKKFKEVSNVICGRSISLKIRGTLYKSYVRNALTYGAECWPLKMEDERRLKTTEMRMLRMMCGKILKDKMNNDKICEMTGVVRLEEFLREKRLRWLGHVERMDEERGPVNALLLEVDGTKKEDRKRGGKKY